MGGGRNSGATLPITRAVQDIPPSGGYPPISYKRGVGPRGPPGWLIWGAILSCTAYGFSQIGRTNEETRMQLKEKRDCRMAIMPFLIVEQDRLMNELVTEQNQREAEIMKNVKGWKVGERVTKRWLPDTPDIVKRTA